MVVAVLGGQLVDGLPGPRPGAQVRQWISQVMEAGEKMGLRLADGAAGDVDDQADEVASDEGARPRPRGTRGPPNAADGRLRAPGRRAGAAGRAASGPGGYSAGGYGAGAPLVPPAYAEARAAMERGDLDAAARAFEKELAEAPGDPVAKTGLAQVNLIRRVSSYDQARPPRAAAPPPGAAGPPLRPTEVDLAPGPIEKRLDRQL